MRQVLTHPYVYKYFKAGGVTMYCRPQGYPSPLLVVYKYYIENSAKPALGASLVNRPPVAQRPRRCGVQLLGKRNSTDDFFDIYQSWLCVYSVSRGR